MKIKAHTKYYLIDEDEAFYELKSAVKILGVEAVECMDNETDVVDRIMIVFDKRAKDCKSRRMLSEIKPIVGISDRLKLMQQINVLAKRLGIVSK